VTPTAISSKQSGFPWGRRVALAFVVGSLCAGGAAAQSPSDKSESAILRDLPFPFSHVVSFASDTDDERPWHGAALHREFNEQLGLTFSDSLWVQGGKNSSSFFYGPGGINRDPSGIGSQPVFALLLREWHRGDIDHFHGWQHDGVFRIQNDMTPPVELASDRVGIALPKVPVFIQYQQTQNVRFYFEKQPPADLSVVFHGEGKKVFSIDTNADARGTGVQIQQAGDKSWIVDLLIPRDEDAPEKLSVNPMLLESVELVAPSCAKGCDNKLLRMERDHFSRQTVLAEEPTMAAWNIRPPLLTSHGGYTFAQDYGVAGQKLDLPRTPGTFFADPTVSVRLEAMADRKDTQNYHSDILRKLGVLGVWPYFPEKSTDAFAVYKDDLLHQLTSTFVGLYNVPRTMAGYSPASNPNAAVPTEQYFLDTIRGLGLKLPEDELKSLFCGKTCDSSQGDAVGLLLAFSISLIEEGGKARNFWYTHFGSGGSGLKATLEQPLTPTVSHWMRRFANYVYNFDGKIDDRRRVWSPPAGTWLRYQIVHAAIAGHAEIDPAGTTISITPWTDPVTGLMIPDPLAGTRDLHGVTFYVKDPSAARVLVAGREVTSVTRNPPDESGRPSVTIVDDNTPTSILGNIALRDVGDVKVLAGQFENGVVDHAEAGSTSRYVRLMANDAGRASVSFTPNRLDLWNISHMRLETRRQMRAGSPPPTGRLKVKLLLDNTGVVEIVEGDRPDGVQDQASRWRIPTTPPTDRWQSDVLDVARLAWPKAVIGGSEWRRPPMPIGRVKEVRLEVEGAQPGETLDIGRLTALRPSGNGEAPDGSKLVAGRVTTDGLHPLPHVRVRAVSDGGAATETLTDQDGYYFFYRRPRWEKLAITANAAARTCFAAQGRQIEVERNEAELDIETDRCLQ
jgi:hypothetical protein